MRLCPALVLAIFVSAASAAPASSPADTSVGKVSLAVADFDASVPGQEHMGPAFADVLSARLSVEDSVVVLERASLAKILAEQKLTLAGMVDPAQAAQAGKLFGARLVILGKAFAADKKLTLVAKVVGVETGRVEGCAVTADLDKPLSDAIDALAAEIAIVILKKAPDLLPKGEALAVPIESLRKSMAARAAPSVAVVSVDASSVETAAAAKEFADVLSACGVKLVSPGKGDLRPWAGAVLKGEAQPWPDALDAQAAVVYTAGSKFLRRTGAVVSAEGHMNIRLVDRKTGKTLASLQQAEESVDLTQTRAGCTALQRISRQFAVAACQAILEGASDAPGLAARPMSATTQAARRVIFAVPFDNETGQEQYDPAAAALGDLVAVMLARQGEVVVVERQQLEKITAEQARQLAGLTGDEYARQAGRLLKADTVLSGRLFLVQDKLTISAKALEIASARVVASDQFSCRPEELLETALQVARSLSRPMSLPLPEIDLKKIDSSPVAGLHFAQALGHFYAGDMDGALMQFMRTIDLDPGYTEALYWSGLCYFRLGEDDHAIIDWEAFLKEQPKSHYAGQLTKPLAEAKRREQMSTVRRLDAATQTAPSVKEGGNGTSGDTQKSEE